jgi:oryzin
MRFSSLSLTALLLALPAVQVLAAPILEARGPDVKDSYIVVYKDGVTDKQKGDHEKKANDIASKKGKKGVKAKYGFDGFQGYQVNLDAAGVAQLAASPVVSTAHQEDSSPPSPHMQWDSSNLTPLQVSFVEKDSVVTVADTIIESRSSEPATTPNDSPEAVAKRGLTTQTGAEWGLARISHKNANTGSTYIYDTTAGQNTRIYVVDTGILTTHTQFGGRASWGANFVTGSANTDENGHGTHCAGTAAGSTYGVAKKAALTAVKVLDANGAGAISGVISGIQWAVNDAVAKGKTKQSVISLSLGAGYSAALNAAVAGAVSKGVVTVVAAGNGGVDASTYSPASEASAITVGATDSNDNRPSFSNFGSYIDVFAPGVSIKSAWIGSPANSNTAVLSGTSMATPHVAGLAAYIIAKDGINGPGNVVNRIVTLSTKNKVVNAGTNSQNRIAYNGSGQ